MPAFIKAPATAATISILLWQFIACNIYHVFGAPKASGMRSIENLNKDIQQLLYNLKLLNFYLTIEAKRLVVFISADYTCKTSEWINYAKRRRKWLTY